MKPTLLIMAAGMGSRYGGLKQIDPVGPAGEIMLDYSVYDALQAGFGRIVFVIRRDIEAPFREVVERNIAKALPVAYAFQERADLPEGFSVPENRAKPWGTAHAVWAARHVVKEPFVVINADDFYGRAAFQGLADALTNTDVASTDFFLAGYRVADTLSEYGSVSRGVCEIGEDGLLKQIVERAHIENREGTIVAAIDGQFLPLAADTTVSMNCWGFTPALFPYLGRTFVQFLETNAENPKAEFAISTIVGQMVAEGAATVRSIPTSARWLGMTYPMDKPLVRAGIAKLVSSGAYPNPLWA